MSLAALLQDVGAACVQGLVVAAAAGLLFALFPLDRPRLRLAWWQAALAAVLLAPWVLAAAWPGAGPGRVESASLGFAPLLEGTAAPLGGRSWAELVAGLLVAGALGRGIRLGRGLRRLERGLRRAVPLSSPALDRAGNELGVRATFLLSEEAGGPATFGRSRPVVLLPRSFLEMDPEGQRAVAVHELLHVRRGDWTRTLAEEALLAVLWFHPAVHWLVGRVRLGREECVDDDAVRVLGSRTTYLEALLEVARRSRPGRAVPAAPFLRESRLAGRVELLLKEVTMSRARAWSHLAVSAASLVLAGALAAWSFPLGVPGGEPLAEPAASPDAGDELEAKTKADKDKDKTRSAKEPRILRKVNPVYPVEAKADGLEGTVLIEVRLAKDGTVAEARVTSGHPTLAEASLAAVRQWRYEPVLGPDGEPVEATLTVTIRFTLA